MSIIWEIWRIIIFIAFIIYLYNVYQFCFFHTVVGYFRNMSLITDFIYFLDLIFKIFKVVLNIKETPGSSILLHFLFIIPYNFISVFPCYLFKETKILYFIKLNRLVSIWEIVGEMKNALQLVFKGLI